MSRLKTQAIIAASVIGVWHSAQGQIGGGSNFPASGLVLFSKFSEGSGNAVADSSGNGHTGYLTNSPAWIPGVRDFALNFVSASQQAVNFGDLNLAGSNQCTFSMWMQKTNPVDIGLAALGCTSGPYNAIFLAWWNNGFVYGGVGSVYAYRYFNAPYVANTWVHFVMVYDGTQLQNSNRVNIFINGVQATPSPDQSQAQTEIATSIGTVSTNFSLSWDSNEGYESGRYDGVGVWNRVLSPTEIQQVYSNAAAGPPSPILSFDLTNNASVSNAAFTVTGTTTGGMTVTNVFYQLNGAGWNTAQTTNGWANWEANVISIPGTNVIQACAVDSLGNFSATNTLNFVYVASATLTVTTNGLGSLNPNYNGASLRIGKGYSITATPGTGFRFTNWTGGTSLPLTLLTNGTTVTFLMISNLMLQANFVDTVKPTLSITNLTSGQRVSSALFTVRGTARDNWQVGNVLCQLNRAGWSNAFTGNVWTNWASAEMTLMPGTNVVSAYAMDTSSNVTPTNSVSFQYVVTNQLGMRAVGLGTLNPNYSNAWLEIGRNYSMTATPGNGFMFTNWTLSTNWIGGVKTNNPAVRFMMKSNLTLQVGFVDVARPTLTITAPTGGQRMTNALAHVRGTASDNWRVTNVWFQLNTDAWSLATSTNGWTNWTVTLPLVTGTNTVRAYAVDLGSNLSPTNSVSFISSNTFKLQLGFGAGPSLDGNGLGFDLQISPGLNGRIEASTNLMDWVTLTNYIGTNATLHFRDVAATNLNHRFYRAVAQ